MKQSFGEQQVDQADKLPVNEKPVIREWPSQQLLGDASEARFLHGTEVYRLIRTRNDKLILVK